MNKNDFVRGVDSRARLAGTQAAVRGLLSNKPQATDALSDVARWYQHLSNADRALVGQAMDRAAALAVFNLLAIIDGAAPMVGIEPGARFELRYIGEDGDVVLNSRNGEDLHDLFATQWFDGQKRETDAQ